MTTTTESAPTDPAAPPEGYPLPEWGAKGSGFYVPPRLRAYYARAAEEDTGGGTDTFARWLAGLAPDEREKQSYDGWTHQRRLQQAETRRRAAESAAEREARRTPCPSCGERCDPADLKTVPHGSAPGFDGGLLRRHTGPSLRVCTFCVPVVELVIGTEDVLEDGRTRLKAAREYVQLQLGRK